MKTHGMSETPTYRSWQAMRVRCTYPNREHYKNYGGRGIRVCERWQKFENFLADMGERPDGTSIDRVNNDGNYEPGNCRWATRAQQANNQRNYHRRGPVRKDLVGKRFTRLVAVEYLSTNPNRQSVWKCVCDCGNTTAVVGALLSIGHTRSCGCLQKERAGGRAAK